MASAHAKTIARLGLVAVSLTIAVAAVGRNLADQTGGASPHAQHANPVAPVAPAAAAAPAASDEARTEKSRELFATAGCNNCHALADAGASGAIGPSLDQNSNLTKPFIIDRVTNGQGPMPAFGGQLSDAEIADLATYIMEYAGH